MKCHEFKLTLYATGSLTLECNTSFTNEFAAIGSREINRNFEGTFNASFTGTTSDDGTVSIDEMAVAVFDFLDHGRITTGDDDNSKSKFVVNFESLDDNSIRFLSEIWERKGQDLNSFPQELNGNLKVTSLFLLLEK